MFEDYDTFHNKHRQRSMGVVLFPKQWETVYCIHSHGTQTDQIRSFKFYVYSCHIQDIIYYISRLC